MFTKKIKLAIASTLIFMLIITFGIGYVILGPLTGEQYPTATQGLEFAKPSEIIELKNGETLNLSIDIIQKEIAGHAIRMFGYNGQIPGPLLKIEQHSTIVVNVVNNLDVETTVHWQISDILYFVFYISF